LGAAERYSALTGGLERLFSAGDNPNRSQELHEPMANVASAMGLNIVQSALPTIKENVVASDPAINRLIVFGDSARFLLFCHIPTGSTNGQTVYDPFTAFLDESRRGLFTSRCFS
jgi:hypothetical protein